MWGWQTAAYLFLGGLAAGLLVSASLLQLAHGSRFLAPACTAACWALALLAAGIVLLLSDVGVPERALNLATSFANIESSWMARGAWGIVSTFAVGSAWTALSFAPAHAVGRFPALRKKGTVLNVLGTACLVLACFLAFYTGMLLNDVPFVRPWATPLVPLLFSLSSLESGAVCTRFLVARMAPSSSIKQSALRRFDVAACALSLAGALALVAYATFLSDDAIGLTRTAAESDVAGRTSVSPAVLILLFALALASDIVTVAQSFPSYSSHRPGTGRRNVKGPLALAFSLAGSLSLRFLVLFAGVFSALAMSSFA